MVKESTDCYTSYSDILHPILLEQSKQAEVLDSLWIISKDSSINDSNNGTSISLMDTSSTNIDNMSNTIAMNGFDINLTGNNTLDIDQINMFHDASKFMFPLSELDSENKILNDSTCESNLGGSIGSLLTTQSSTCWTLMDQQGSLIDSNSNDLNLIQYCIFNKNNNEFTADDDDNILDSLSHVLSKSCLEEDDISNSHKIEHGINSISNQSLINFNNSQLSNQSQIGSQQNQLNNQFYTLGLRVMTRNDITNKSIVSCYQLNTHDVINLCSPFGTIIGTQVTDDIGYATYDSCNSLYRALNVLQNLPLSSNGDFLHVFIHQVSNILIGGLDRPHNIGNTPWGCDITQNIHSSMSGTTSNTPSSISAASSAWSNYENSNCNNNNESNIWNSWVLLNRLSDGHSTCGNICINSGITNENATSNTTSSTPISPSSSSQNKHVSILLIDPKEDSNNNDNDNNNNNNNNNNMNNNNNSNNNNNNNNAIGSDNNLTRSISSNNLKFKSNNVSLNCITSSSCNNTLENVPSSVIKKYTARYEIQIPPDNQFQIARRIIGTRGVNMKRIFKLTQSKLRLRGRGSGYLEGYNKQEADEPLHLCISSTNYEQYMNARKLVEKLLLKIYQEYDEFLILGGECNGNSKNNTGVKPMNLQLKFKETLRTKQQSNNDRWIN